MATTTRLNELQTDTDAAVVVQRQSPISRDVEPVRRYSVQHVRQETADTFTVEIEPSDGAPRNGFAPGQFNMLYLYGAGEIPISISGDPTRNGPLVHTTRNVGVVTRAMQRLRAGDTLGVRGPFGAPWPVEAAWNRDVVIVAGGIGLAPLRSALYAMLAKRERYGNIVLLYGTRSPEDILYRRELEKWRAQLDLEVYVTVDRAMNDWRGNVGVVTSLISRAPFNAQETIAMVCGPEVMMRFTVMELLNRGVRAGDIYLSMERNMKCATGHCGHCQLGPYLVCRDGPVFSYDRLEAFMGKREV